MGKHGTKRQSKRREWSAKGAEREREPEPRTGPSHEEDWGFGAGIDAREYFGDSWRAALAQDAFMESEIGLRLHEAWDKDYSESVEGRPWFDGLSEEEQEEAHRASRKTFSTAFLLGTVFWGGKVWEASSEWMGDGVRSKPIASEEVMKMMRAAGLGDTFEACVKVLSDARRELRDTTNLIQECRGALVNALISTGVDNYIMKPALEMATRYSDGEIEYCSECGGLHETGGKHNGRE